MNQGNRKQQIFEDERDRVRFRQLMLEEKLTHGVDICGDCQMGNHFHMIVTTPNGNLADFVGALEGRFASYSNWRHDHVGHLFRNRYKDVYIENDIHLLTALCYVFLNPVSAGYASRIEDYRWSTFSSTVGFVAPPAYVSLEWLSKLYPGHPFAEAQRRFSALFAEAKPVCAYFQQHDVEVDAEAVKRVIRSYVGENLRLAALPREYRSALRDSLEDLLPPGTPRAELASAIYEARAVHGYRIAEIARHLRVRRATVSKIFHSFCKASEQDVM